MNENPGGSQVQFTQGTPTNNEAFPVQNSHLHRHTDTDTDGRTHVHIRTHGHACTHTAFRVANPEMEGTE